MVHTTTARSVDRAAISPHLGAISDTALCETRPMPARYILVPDALITAFAHDPMGVGVYVAVARLTMAAKAAVPLAARDLAIWMGSDRDADRVAIMRRIVKLEARGWLMITRTRTAKHCLLPTWGRNQAGTVRPLRFDTPDSGRPQHLRGRRVPIGLLDDYLGRLEPQPDSGRALLSRYFTRPLLNLTDIGVYTIGLRAEITPTPRLQHLELCSEAGMLPLPDIRSLLAQAAAGTLTTYVDDATIAVRLSVHGYARLGLRAPMNDQPTCAAAERPNRSADGSGHGSHESEEDRFAIGHQEASNRMEGVLTALIAWDVGMIHESTNHDSTADRLHSGGGQSFGRVDCQVAAHALSKADIWTSTNLPIEPLLCDVIPGALDGAVIAGHRLLNPERTLCAGEWLELLALQAAHGVEQILIWQARAGRSIVERPFGVMPAYYHACAARAPDAVDRSHVGRRATAKAGTHEANDAQPRRPMLDPRCGALLRAIGVREPRTLAATPLALIEAWFEIIAHPGLAARFDSPVGFAVQQMRQGHMPPPRAELERWAARATRAADRYDAYRHMAAPASSVEGAAVERNLEERVRTIAPPGTDIADLCRLADWLEQGATEADALARLAASDGGDDV